MAIVLWIGSISCTFAQNVMSVLELNKSTRSTAMGGISSAMDASAFSIFDNASKSVYTTHKVEVGVQYSPWAKGLTRNQDKDNVLLNFGGYYSIDNSRKILLGLNYFKPGGDDLYAMDSEGNQTGKRISPQFISVHGGIAYRLKDWSLSGTLQCAIWNPGMGNNVINLGIDVSANRRIIFNNTAFIDMSTCLYAWGSTISGPSGYKLPGLFSLSSWYKNKLSNNHSIHVGIELGGRCLDEPSFFAGIGAEYCLNNIVFLRGGYHISSRSYKDKRFGSVGLGLHVFNTIKFDFAYLFTAYESPLRNTFKIAISVGI